MFLNDYLNLPGCGHLKDKTQNVLLLIHVSIIPSLTSTCGNIILKELKYATLETI